MFTEKEIDEAIKKNYKVLYVAILHAVWMDEAKAEDLTHDAVIKIITYLRKGKYKEQGAMKAWMIKVGVNIARDYQRKERRLKTYPIDIESNDGRLFERTDLKEYYYSDIELNYEEKLIYDYHIKNLRNIARALPLKQMEVFILRHTFKYSFKEISERTNTSINTVLGRMRCSLRNIRRSLGNPSILTKKKYSELEGSIRCTKCKDCKPKKEFSRRRSRKTGINAWCKICIKNQVQAPRLS